MCHSTCATCNTNYLSTGCATCPSSATMVYNAFATGVTTSSCTLTTNNNAQLLITVGKNTALGTGTPGLTSVTYNGITNSVATTLLGGLMYT